MKRRGGKMMLDELVNLTNQTEDYSTGDLVISSTTTSKFFAKVRDLMGRDTDTSPLNDKYRDNRAIKIIARVGDTDDVDLGSQLVLQRDSNTTYTVQDIYGGPDYKFYRTIIAYSTAN